VYGPVPLEAVTVIDPLQAPKQVTFVTVVIFAEGDPAFGTVTLTVNVQRFASVTVHV
jgi:hypothetical protein